MHVPDGFLDVTTSLATGGVAAGAVAVSLRRARSELDERTAPLAGLVAAFVFAVQMLNFPVGVGTSGHLLGGALAAVLVGPYTATLAISVVLFVQALLFADGGLTALGTNITLMALVGVWGGWLTVRAVLAVLPRRPASVMPASFVGALVSVPLAALAFTLLFVLGGAADLPVGGLAATMLGWHTLIGVGEAVITSLTVSSVVAVRPDLVYAARGLRPALEIRTAHGTRTVPAGRPAPVGGGGRVGPFVIAGATLSLLLAGVVSFYASGRPDGLEYVAESKGFVESATDHAFGGSPLADYGEVGGIPVGVVGVLGVLLTLAVGYLLFRRVSRRADEQVDDRVRARV